MTMKAASSVAQFIVYIFWVEVVLGLVVVDAQYLNISDIRLVGGSGTYGRVEVNIKGIWGTVCDYGFDMNDAKVMCKMLNLQATAFHTGGYYGQGQGPIVAQQFNCYGYESSLRSCRFVANALCTHNRDVGIICTECGEISSTNGMVNRSADGKTVSTTCYEGFEAQYSQAVCESGRWSVPTLACTPIKSLSRPVKLKANITDIRLANGVGLADGRVEIFVNGTWGTICSNSFGWEEAHVACKMLGFPGRNTYFSSASSYGEGTGPIYLANLECTYADSSLNDCTYDVVHTCTHSQDIGVGCNAGKLNITNVRLVNGSGPYDGRVEFQVDHKSGTVYIDQSSGNYIQKGLETPETICRMLNLSLSTYFDSPVYGEGRGPVLMTNPYCSSVYDHINSCSYSSPYYGYGHQNDLTLSCLPCGIPPNIKEETVVLNGTKLTAECFSGFSPSTVTMTCKANAQWDTVCHQQYGYPLNITDIRLEDIYDLSWPSEGLVRILVNGTWGGICSNKFDSADASVICKMMDMEYYSFSLNNRYRSNTVYGRNKVPVFIDNLDCSGNETHINECTYNVGNNCTYWDDVAILCTGYQLNITDIRLSGTNSSYSGRIEVRVNDIWGTVCDKDFYSTGTYVICRMLGFGGYYRHYYNAFFGQGTGPIFIDKLYCSSSSYDNINQCKYAPNNYYNSTHADDLSITCFGPKLNITGARLVNGSGPDDGRAEISVNGVWGTICDQNFNILAADLFCQLSHKRAIKYYTGSTHGPGTGPIYIEQIFCQTYHNRLSDCDYLHLNTCNHQRDVSVVCSACGQPDLSAWDVDFFQYNGSDLHADCSYYKTYVGVMKMKCNNLTGVWYTEGECFEYSYPLGVEDIRLIAGTNSSSGRVEIKSLGTWGTVCSHSFGMTEANVICRMIGYPPAVSISAAGVFLPGSGPIFVDDLSCHDNASHINNCTYNTHDNCQHKEDVAVTCTDCGIPIHPSANGYVNTTKSNVGSVVKVSCENGYRMDGDDVITCLDNGKWSPNVPSCIYIDCGDPTPDNGKRNTTNTSNGTVATISCLLGYELIGNPVIVCMENDTWTDYTKCNIKDCGQPNQINADVKLPSNKTTYGEQAVITCWEGYRPEASITVTCQANATWEQWPICEIVDCGDPRPNRGIVNSTDTKYGVVVGVSCEEGFNLTGPDIITCLSDGSWSGSPICDTSDCGGVQLSNGYVDTPNGTSAGALAFASCNPGYDLSGSEILLCAEQGWNGTLTCKKQDCGDPTPENGMRTDNGGTLFGETATLACDKGYQLNGDKTISCQDGSKWSDTTFCVLKDCGNVTLPANALTNGEGTKYGSTVRFSCLSGFSLVGSSSIRCESTGTWSDSPPQCFDKLSIGSNCQNSKQCRSAGAVCRKSVCTCVTGVHDNITNTCDSMPLLPYGPREEDEKVPATSNCGPAIRFRPGIPLFTKNHKDVFVCASGYITFDSLYTNPTPPKDRQNANIRLNKETLLAPFYGNIDIRNSGPVYYRTYDIMNSHTKMKRDAELISYIERFVKNFGNLAEFETSFLLIATWTETACVSDELFGSNKKTSTFQVVVVSDGRNTYAFNIYGQGQMRWAEDSNLSTKHCENVFVGYSAESYVFTHPMSYSQQALQLDQRPEPDVMSKLDVAGLIFKSMTSPSHVHNNHAVDCIRWYNADKEDRNDLDYIASLMPECPCDIQLSRFDPWFWRIGLHQTRTDVKYVCVDMLPTGNFAQYGKSCCYDLRTRSWVYERPLAGGFQLYHPQKYKTDNFVHDVLPKENCCVYSDNCYLFYRLRPSGSCYRRSPYNFGAFWGDPHFSTLDKLKFTFNGLGEFTLLQVQTENRTFDLQARTERAVRQDGNLSDATIFSAFAAKDSSNASVHVELNKAKTGINVYANKADVTTEFNSDVTPFEFTSENGNIYLAKSESALTVLFPQSGISLNISVNVGMLSLNTIVPQTLRNSSSNLRGLLGNYDGNPYNDFMLPNGTVLPSNMTERQIFEYGMTWSINDEDSAFVYEKGKNHSHFHNASYVPRFLDEADPDKRTAAEKLCGGHENFECVFDYVFTGQEAVAMATAALREKIDLDQELLETSPPGLTGCNTTQVIIGQRVICRVEYDDDDANIKFIENSVGATFDKDSSSIIYIQTTDDPVDIQVVSTNKKNRSSPVFRLEIEFCTGCNGHGNCTQEIRVDNRSTEYFKYFTCKCEPEYEGDDCEKEFDGCAASPCSHDRACTRLSAEQQKLLGRAYYCASCPAGYQEYGNTCKDINECYGTDLCQQMCNNTDGSFVCTCHSGYRVDPANTHTCKDINECDEATHNCSQLCINTDGGFNCTCHAGYYFNTSMWMCLENEDPVCSATALQRCANTNGCTLDIHGDEVCFCDAGFKLDELQTSCQDVNECELNVCQHTCNNTVGSFQCSCYTGYKLTGLTTCEDCVIPFWGENCKNKCICSERGADSCDPVKGCICINGWQGVSCNEDIDECEINNNVCSDPKTECLNTQGSYICSCIAGYALQANGLCGDIDECSSPLLNDCSDICTNSVGGYSCSCNTGFTASNGTHCTDIDECSLGRHHCQQQCVNRPGSYSCFCHFGYTLNDDRQSCEEQNNFCAAARKLTCDHYCLLEGDLASCKCFDGYSLGTDNQTCTDINECYSSELNQCDPRDGCTNIEGSYLCLCPNGTKLENNGRTCTECDSFHFGVNCSETCSCVRGLCDKITGCSCDPGWTGNQCDQDVDECASRELTCDEANSICVNTPGGAKCSCRSGFVNTSGICTECTGNTYGSNCLLDCNCNATNANNSDQTCSPVTGDCVCNAFWTGTLCDDDVNECDAPSTCNTFNHEVCVNTVGLFRCDCLRGFTEESDGTCIEDVQSTNLPKEANLMINLTITIDYDLPAANNLNSSVVYRDIESAINNSLVQFYTRFIKDMVVVIIWDIRRGSVVVDYSVVTTESDDTKAQLIEATSALVTGTTILVQGQNVIVISDTYKASELCDLYEALLGTCSEGYRCVVSNGQPFCRLEGEEKVDWPMFVGITVGVVIFIVVLAAGGMWCLQFKNRKNTETRPATILERETSSVFRSVENWKYGQERKNQTLRDIKARAICPEYEDIYMRENQQPTI